MNVLLSIKPEYSQKILSGEKKYEFRKRIPNKKITKVYIYESDPTKKIVGWFTVKKIITGDPESIWDRCNGHGGVVKDFFISYCNGNKNVYAIEINNFHKYEKPIDPYKMNEDFYPPQSYYFIDDRFVKINGLV